MKVGITGTRHGMDDEQRLLVENLLIYFFKKDGEDEFHHGDCVGVDAEAAAIAKSIGYGIICHPPIISLNRAFFVSDLTAPVASYFQRNRNIVDETDHLIVVPFQDTPRIGGTWYTHDYAKRNGKSFSLISRAQGIF